MTKYFNQTQESLLSHRVTIVGRSVATVQHVSRYCIKQGLEVLPYYGVPTSEEMALFAPALIIVCLPTPENFLLQTERPVILWSEQPTEIELPVASNYAELSALLQQTLPAKSNLDAQLKLLLGRDRQR